jgi:nucleoid-associated protein YgaU
VPEPAPAEPSPAPQAKPPVSVDILAPSPLPEAVADAAPTEPAATTAEADPEAEEAAEDSIPTLIARRIGGPDAERFASGTAIIRRGDNLWSIARRVYGDGLKYTTIYRANKGQIRNPARIYPGQVFDLPLVYDDD